MNRLLALTLVAALLCPLTTSAVTPSVKTSYTPDGISIRLLDPIGSVYREDEAVGFTVRTDRDAYVVVFDIDTDGFVHLLYPAEAGNLQRFYADRVYNLPEGAGESYSVTGAKGLEFVFAVAVEDRDALDADELHFLSRSEMLPEDRRFRITGDPFLGANRVVRELVKSESARREASISFTYFYIDEAVDYPRYLCDDCYGKGRDPYAESMPSYAAVADFEKTDGLVYPLSEGFAPQGASGVASGYTETQSAVTKVYVSYYPRWDDGFYATSWWYLDPWYWNVWYWDPWYAPYTGFYVNIGWNWGWGAYHYYYFPYYYGGPYYAYRPWWGYYGCYPDYGYGPWYYPSQPSGWRSYGVVPKGQRTSALHTAMNQRVNRNFGLAQASVKSMERSGARVSGTKSLGGERSLQSFEKRTVQGKADPRVIRSKPVRESKETRIAAPRDRRESKEIRSGQTPYREQRVITRPQGTKRVSDGDRQRTSGAKGRDVNSSEIGRRSAGGSKSQPGVVPNTVRQKPENRGTYAPNVRRGGGERSAPARSSGGSWKAPSSPRSSAPARTTGSSGGSPRQKR